MFREGRRPVGLGIGNPATDHPFIRLDLQQLPVLCIDVPDGSRGNSTVIDKPFRRAICLGLLLDSFASLTRRRSRERWNP